MACGRASTLVTQAVYARTNGRHFEQRNQKGETSRWPQVDFLLHLASAARFAISFLLRAERLSARALPPFDARSAESACACTFLPSAGFNTSPVASSTTRRAFWIGSACLSPMLAREGIAIVLTVIVTERKRENESWHSMRQLD